MNNKRHWVGICGAILLALGGGAIYTHQTQTSESTNQIEGQVKTGQEVSAEAEDSTDQDQLVKAAQEELDTEDIIVKITEEGFMTINGGHYHFHKGEVPFDQVFSEELLAPDSYKFNKNDVVSEIDGGYIVNIDGEMFVYLQNPSNTQNIRTQKEIENQTTKIENYVQESRKERIAKQKETAGKTLFGGRRIAGRYTTDDGYVFSPTDVINDLGDGYLVPHGDHFHFIPKSDLSASELAAAQRHWSGKSGSSLAKASGKKDQRGQASGGRTNQSQGWQKVLNQYQEIAKNSPSQSGGAPVHASQGGRIGKTLSQSNGRTQTENPLVRILADLYNTPASKARGKRKNNIQNTRHVEGDGLVFDPLKITKDTGSGYVIPHGDHFHVIPYDWLSDLERAAAEMVMSARANKQKLPTRNQIKQAQKQAKKVTANKPAKVAKTKQPSKSKDSNKQKEDKQPAKPTEKEESTNKETGPFGPVGKYAPDGHLKATPLNERQGKPNSKIIFSAEEIKVAKAKGHYTTSDGYIFDAADIIESNRSGYVTAHMDHIHYIPAKALSAKEQKAAKDFWQGKQTGKGQAGQTGESTEKDKGQANVPQAVEKPNATQPFTPENVIQRTSQFGRDVYIYQVDGQKYTAFVDELDLQDRAFAELQLNLNQNQNYVYQIAPPKEGELPLGLYVPISHLPMKAGTATIDTGELFAVPHIDHLHLVFYKNLKPEQIATIKYLMTNPEYRPAPWMEQGHEVTISEEVKYVPNVTPKSERASMKNWQIIHSAEEVNAAIEKGIYARDDGYIFHPSDLLDEKTFILWDSWSIPTLNGGYRSINKNDIDVKYHKEIDQKLAQRKEADVKKSELLSKEPTNRELMDFLAEFFDVKPLWVRWQFGKGNFIVYLTDNDFIEVDKADVIAAYNGDQKAIAKLNKHKDSIESQDQEDKDQKENDQTDSGQSESKEQESDKKVTNDQPNNQSDNTVETEDKAVEKDQKSSKATVEEPKQPETAKQPEQPVQPQATPKDNSQAAGTNEKPADTPVVEEPQQESSTEIDNQ